MNGDHTIMVEILDAIEHGNLSVHETRRRLERIIDTEIEKTDAPANMQLIEECEKLLWALNTNGQMPYISQMEENHAAVRKRSAQKHLIHVIRGNAFRVCAAVAALFVLLIGAEALLHREWLSSKPTDDEQQQVIRGEVIDPGLMQDGVASENEQTRSQLNTTNMDSAIAFLGFDFNIPETLQNDWTLSYIDCSKSKRNNILVTQFTHSSDPQKTLTINVHQFISTPDAYLTFEQNKTGSTVKVNNIELYLSTNNTRTRCMWIIDNCVYSIDGLLENTEALKIANQIIGES